MRQPRRRILATPMTCWGAALLGLAASPAGWTQEKTAAPAESRPLDLLLTREELRAVIRNYEDRTGDILTTPISDEEILVTAPGVQAPMRDVSQDVMGGIAAPFWAIAHPTQSWRILVPIPQKGERIDERPAPDPR